MPGSIMNHLLKARYEKLWELSLELKNEEIMGTFVSVIRENGFVGTNQCTLCEASSSTKIKRRRKLGQETFETCLERKINDVIQL